MHRRLATVVTASSLLFALAIDPIPDPHRPTAGDPVDLSTGLYVRESDDIVLDGLLPIRFTRTYRNRDPGSRAFGIGTSHPYNLALVGDTATYQQVDLIMPDGGRVHYVRTSPGTDRVGAQFLHTATPSKFYLSRLSWNGNGWDIDLRDGSRYSFPTCPTRVRLQQCALSDYRDGSGRRLTLTREDSGNLTRIRGGWFKKIDLTYDSGHRIVSASTGLAPTMTTVAYVYDERGRLVRVHWKQIGVRTVLFELLAAVLQRRWPFVTAMR